MKFLADENIPKDLVRALRGSGYNIKDVKEEKLFGIPDEKVLEIGKNEERIVLTLDKDFLYASQRSLHKGVIVLRFSNLRTENIIKKFLFLLQQKQTSKKFAEATTIVTDNYIEIIKKP